MTAVCPLRCRLWLLLLPVLFSLLLPASANTLNVPASYTTIQGAVNAAANGDTVLVSPGTYSGDGNRDIDFEGKSLTVTSSTGAANTIIDCGGSNTSDGSGDHRGFIMDSGEANATISGFTIENGYEAYASSIPNSGPGGGIFINNSGGAITVSGCIVIGNYARIGGGIYADNTGSSGNITLTGCTLANNTATSEGGGIYNENDEPSDSITLTACTFTGNTAEYNGGGVYNVNGDGGTTTLTNSTITDNTVDEEGAGVYNYNDGGTVAVTNCSFTENNTTVGYAGGVYSSNYNLNALTGTITLTNDILYGDSSEVINDSGNNSNPVVTFCDVQGGYSGTGNINTDPLFVSAPSDLHLQSTSPCIGAGTHSGAPATDKDGATRNNPPSIGAYEGGLSLTVPGPYPTIQSAINAAQNGQTVTVADGTYTGPGNVDLDFLGKSITVTSQHGAASTIIDCGGSSSSDGSGDHRGFYIHSGEMNATISGFTIKNGYEAYNSSIPDSDSGGGIFINNNNGGTVTVSGCTVINNVVDTIAGGIAAGNTSSNIGTINLTNCTVSNNTAGIGGGIFNENDEPGDTITLTGCTVANNTATADGGGIYNVNGDGGSTTLTNSTFASNTASTYGGGVYTDNDGGTVAITNCSFTANTASSADGGGVYSENVNLNTLTATITLTNDIFYGDNGGEVVNQSGNDSNPVVTFCDVQGGYSSTGNINANPLFVNAPSDLHLQSGSPCAGAGTHSGAPATDKDGKTRPNPPSIGAYEPSASALTALALSPTSLYGGAPAYGKVTLAGPAASGGQTVTLASSSSLVTVPASVTVAAGYSSATFAMTTASVTADTPVTITATQGTVTENATLTLLTKYTVSGTIKENGSPLTGASVALSGTGSFLLTKNLTTVQAIPDNNATGITQSITVPDIGTITDLKLGVNITHPNVADLVVTLTGPDGTSVVVHNRTSGSPNLITDYPTLTLPDNSLSAFNGKATNGTWTLTVQDRAAGNTGSLNAWDLTFSLNGSVSRTLSTDSAGNYSFSSLKPATYSIVPSDSGLVFSPTSRTVTVGPSLRNQSFTAYPVPTVTSFTPTSGGVGTVVTVTGTGFTGATSVVLHGTTMHFILNSDTQITATVPSGATTGHIDVTTPGGTAVSPHNFTVVAGPTLTSFTPTSGPIGTSVTLTGTNFTGATAVSFHGTAATTFTVSSSTKITATVPSGATTGTITVTTPGGTATSASSFTVQAAPTISGFTPTSGPVGTNVTISGSSFTSTVQVKFHGTAATTYSVVSDTQITATVPSGATTGTISVTNSIGTTTSSASFTVLAPPTITSFSPSTGAAGMAVTITGTKFTGATSVTFNGTAATFTVASDTQINATVPSGAATGLITVTTPGGHAASATNFTVVVAPKITSLSPTSAYAGGDSLTLTVNGTGFNSAAVVHFGSTALTTTFVSSTQLTATITSTLRANVGAFNVTVVNPGNVTSNSQTFTLKPRLTALTLAATRVAGAQTVTGTLILNGAAPTGGIAIALTSSDTSRATVPSSVTVPANATSVTFPVTILTVTSTGGTTIASNGAGGSPSVFLTVMPPVITSADTFGQDGSSANTNFGTISPLLVKTASSPGTNRDTYLKFSVSGFTSITSANLQLTASLSGSGSLMTGVFGTSSSWTETGLTWNNRPSLGSSLGSLTVTSTSNVVYGVEVTSYIQSALSAGVASFGLHNPSTSTIVTRIVSREAGSGAAQLVLAGN